MNKHFRRICSISGQNPFSKVKQPIVHRKKMKSDTREDEAEVMSDETKMIEK